MAVLEAKKESGGTLMHPVLFKFHGITLYSYGFCVALAVTLALLILIKQAPAKRLPANTAIDLLFILFVAGVVGARIFYVIQHLEDYRVHWVSVFWVQEGGLVWYGGFVFALLAGFFYCRRHHLAVLAWADLFAPLLSLAHGIGRIGCFLNGCCYGKDGHPVQLYESFGLLAITGVLFWIASKKTYHGEVTVWYLFLYSLLRFGVEFFRGDQEIFYFLTIPQWISAALFLFALGLWGALRASGHEHCR